MNPLVVTDLHTYLRRLVDQQMPFMEGDEQNRSGNSSSSPCRSAKGCPDVEEKETKP